MQAPVVPYSVSRKAARKHYDRRCGYDTMTTFSVLPYATVCKAPELA